jgi:2-methylcitrate dehydratase
MSGGTAQQRLARFACDTRYESLPEPIVAWAKDVLLDTLGCALSGQASEPARIGAAVLSQLGGTPESTVLGSGLRLPCTSAAWLNGTATRYQDLNDTYPVEGRIGHFSEVIPTALAVGERAGASGADVLAAIVVGYEVLAATTFHGPRVGVGFATFGAIASPVVAGKLLGLSEEQLVSAIGVSLSSNVTLVSWLGESPASMLKATTWSTNAHHGILAALLAGEGFTGPVGAIETYLRTVDVSDPEVRLPPPGAFAAPANNMLKRYAAQMLTNGPIEAVLRLAREHAIRPGDVEAITVTSTSELVRYAGGDAAARPRSREAADHSLPYVVAIALVEGDVLPAQYAREQWEDPQVVELMQKVSCRADPELDRVAAADGSMPAHVEIRASGRRFEAEIASPRGHAANPMSREEIEEKFRRVVAPYLGKRRQDAVVELVAGLDDAASVGPLLQATVL